VTALALVAIPVSSYAQGSTAAKPPATKSTEQKPAAPKAMTAAGTVSAVAPDSLSVKGKTDSWTFVIDSKTEVTAKGATHKTLALKADGKTPTLTDFVKNGDTVSVSYHDANGSKHASVVRVTMAAPKK
jgi:hypothetical protein